ncbi:MAG: Stp1/IreP family PP2C-type Ser/Thr phosphatase [Burkholderiales bacterium]|nr:Stp1/IreP family PP2C-type Ser/Thr phosphatase [Burkholderiales bacterium]MBI3728547.1 Stp1/IreP family PP2C-type Ser/Thr phosphatase [Burkholderiales bacterium]
MPYQRVLKFAALSDTGLVRSHNEDAIVVCADYGCVVLADGMGGYNAGEVASAMTAQIIAEYLCSKMDAIWFPSMGPRPLAMARWITESVELANRNVLYTAQTNADCAGMGTTVVVACCLQDKLLLAHVGDSRAYRYRSGALTRLTQDHSVLQEQINAGLVTEEEARYSSIKNLITRAVGTLEEVHTELHTHHTEEEDLYLICSDGLTDMLGHDEIQSLIRQYESDLDRCAEALIDGAKDRGGLDNISAVLFRLVNEENKSWLQRTFTR